MSEFNLCPRISNSWLDVRCQSFRDLTQAHVAESVQTHALWPSTAEVPTCLWTLIFKGHVAFKPVLAVSVVRNIINGQICTFTFMSESFRIMLVKPAKHANSFHVAACLCSSPPASLSEGKQRLG